MGNQPSTEHQPKPVVPGCWGQSHRWALGLVALIGMISGCLSERPDNLKHEGEECILDRDCRSPLECIDYVCAETPEVDTESESGATAWEDSCEQFIIDMGCGSAQLRDALKCAEIGERSCAPRHYFNCLHEHTVCAEGDLLIGSWAACAEFLNCGSTGPSQDVQEDDSDEPTSCETTECKSRHPVATTAPKKLRASLTPSADDGAERIIEYPKRD